MRYLIYKLTACTFALALSLSAYCQPEKPSIGKTGSVKTNTEKASTEKTTTLDVNVGSANINFNPVNNNKMTTQLRNFGPNPAPALSQPVDLFPLATSPLTRPVGKFMGAYKMTEAPDPDITNAKEADALMSKTGWNNWHKDRAFRKDAIETVADDKPIDGGDIQDFLRNYYGYLRESNLSSGSMPIVPDTIKPSKTIGATPKKEPELLANQQKLLFDDTQSVIKDPAENSH